MKKISGEVIKVDHVIPEKGMISQMQIMLTIFVDRKEPVPVYLGPQWYTAGPDRRSLYKAGDMVTVTGIVDHLANRAFHDRDDGDRRDRTFRLRQEGGTPIWSGWERRKNQGMKQGLKGV